MYVKYVVGAINTLYILYNPISCICFRNKLLLYIAKISYRGLNGCDTKEINFLFFYIMTKNL